VSGSVDGSAGGFSRGSVGGSVGGPVLRVIRGDATPEEIAALLAVVAARSRSVPAAGSRRPTSAWTDRAQILRAPVAAGPGAWRQSAWPR
jgi:hypothetical protein